MSRSRALGLTLVLTLACSPGAQREPAASGPVGEAAALVDGQRVSLDEVRRLSAASGLSPRAALEQLVRERLLARYAERRGYGELRRVERELSRARVQALLAREIEASGSPVDVEARRSKLERLLAALRERVPVAYDESAIQKAFASTGE